MHSGNNRLVRQGPGSGGAHVVFNECNITATNGAREQVSVSTARVTFNRCVLTQNQGDTYRALDSGRGRQQHASCIHFNGPVACAPTLFVQRAAGRRWPCVGARLGRAAASTIFSSHWSQRIERHAVDFDLNWYNGGRSGNFPGLKTISVKPQNRSWPCVDAEYDWVVTLPAQALIANILISRPANAGPASAVIPCTSGTATGPWCMAAMAAVSMPRASGRSRCSVRSTS